jgi:hypothetical protein
MSAAAQALAFARTRGYRDPSPWPESLDLDGDPIERAAACLWALGAEALEPARELFTTSAGVAEAARRWVAQEPATRQLYRRRAVVVLLVAAGPSKGGP